jgi:hypothetical protein
MDDDGVAWLVALLIGIIFIGFILWAHQDQKHRCELYAMEKYPHSSKAKRDEVVADCLYEIAQALR